MNPDLTENKNPWNDHHGVSRYRLQFPNEDVVRFLAASFPSEKRENLEILDIGCGTGRHTKLISEMGFRTTGIDSSERGVKETRELLTRTTNKATVLAASMSALPFPDATFDGAISFGVFYYGNALTMRKAIAELHRVLKPGAHSLVVLRSIADHRMGKGLEIEKNTFILNTKETNEFDMTVHFLSEVDVFEYFSIFSNIELDRRDFTFQNRSRLNSDWIVTLQK